MPNVKMPDGAIVRFPDDMPPEQIKSLIASKFPDAVAQPRVGVAAGAPEPPMSPSIMEDSIRSAGAGLRQGVEGMVGTIGDAANMQGDAAGWIARKLGLGGYGQEIARKAGSVLHPGGIMPSTDQVRGVGDAAIGKSYEPQTMAGEYSRTVGQFAPAMIGPGSIGRKVASTLVPAIASETAGQLTKGSEAEPYARFAGGLAGGLATMGRNPSAVKQAAKGAPTQMELKAQTDALYGQMRNAGIKYDANAYGNAVVSMARDLKKAGFRESVAKDAYAVVRELADDVKNGRSPDFDDINGLIQAVGGKARDAARMGDNTSATAFGIIRDKLDDFEASATMISNTPMPKAQFDTLRKAARSTAFRNIKARALDEVVAKADTYAAGMEAGIRNGIGNLLRSKRGMQMFKGEERKALLEVAQGRKALRTLSRFGFDVTKWGGNATFLPAMAALGTGVGLGPVAGAGLAAAGTLAKAASPAMTKRAFDQATAAIRSGQMNSPAVKNAMKGQQLERMIRLLLAGEGARGSALAPSPLPNP